MGPLPQSKGKVLLHHFRSGSLLSNFAATPFRYTRKGAKVGRLYPTLEHAYVEGKILAFGEAVKESRKSAPGEWEAKAEHYLQKYKDPLQLKQQAGTLVPKEWSQGPAWNLGGRAHQLMHELMLAKFHGNDRARAALLETGENYLAEYQGCTHWGIGIHPVRGQHPLFVAPERKETVEDPLRHPGLNVQGVTLMSIRSKLMTELAHQPVAPQTGGENGVEGTGPKRRKLTFSGRHKVLIKPRHGAYPQPGATPALAERQRNRPVAAGQASPSPSHYGQPYHQNVETPKRARTGPSVPPITSTPPPAQIPAKPLIKISFLGTGARPVEATPRRSTPRRTRTSPRGLRSSPRLAARGSRL